MESATKLQARLRANLAKLPDLAYHTAPASATGPGGHPPIVAITRGEAGYNPVYTRLTADDLNFPLGVTRAQAEAMLNGSMFGWGTPSADPDNKINMQSGAHHDQQ